MKIAICLSGADRAFEITSEFLVKNLIEPLNADVYVHTWDPESFDDRFPRNQSNESLYKKICKNYKIERLDSDWNFIQAKKPNNIVPMYYSMYRSFSMVPEGYDVVIRSRFDALYDNLFTVPTIKEKNIHVTLSGRNRGRFLPRRNFIFEGNPNWKFVPDNFAIGDYESMKVYSTTYLNLNNLKTTVPETCLAEQLDNNNITYQFYDELKYLALSEKNKETAIFESDYEDKVIKYFKLS